MDVSANTRETTLEVLWGSLTRVSFEDYQKSLLFEQEFIKTYLPIVIERADDNSLGVRKKVV
jgi:hypothetical protein